ncbi:hypothetical protein SAMN05428949_0040 [Chitinophaga sp. YR627]|uniref:hypothetical protein n=1 Tax=Chitinophaga sp. YR627 TaxID=1881041 RepID=UPI0008E0E765|nr:hypothetical protein [Chitinophaga sp. YR627]SFM57751.1 hypothetical protein SAMN05428949_0040 [Chitinophaga sp. YR627]
MRLLIMLTGAFFTLATDCYSQQKNTPAVSFNGLYISKTGTVADGKIDVYTYLRFYNDGSVYSQTVSSLDAQAVSAWFGRYKQYAQKGYYQVKGPKVDIQLSNKGLADARLEGEQQTMYEGNVSADNRLCLTAGSEKKENCFNFYPVMDTTVKKYSQHKANIKLPGEWKVKQILEGGQVFFINADSTIAAMAVFPASEMESYKEGQDDFVTTETYYEWDSNYMRDERKMTVKKITENKDKSFIIWNAKDQYNDNNFLFGTHNGLVYNIMIYDKKMPVEQQLRYIEMLYDLNKE